MLGIHTVCLVLLINYAVYVPPQRKQICAHGRQKVQVWTGTSSGICADSICFLTD